MQLQKYHAWLLFCVALMCVVCALVYSWWSGRGKAQITPILPAAPVEPPPSEYIPPPPPAPKKAKKSKTASTASANSVVYVAPQYMPLIPIRPLWQDRWMWENRWDSHRWHDHRWVDYRKPWEVDWSRRDRDDDVPRPCAPGAGVACMKK